MPSESIDTIISTWVIGTVQGIKRRTRAVLEAKRVLRRRGSIYLVENDFGGEFEMIRGRYPDIQRTKEYNDWLEQEMGFVPISSFDTYFEFDSRTEAEDTIRAIWGEKAAQKVEKRDIQHRIIIYGKRKE